MIQVKIIKNNVVTNGPVQFETQEFADNWLASCQAKNKFGLPGEYTIVIEDITAQLASEQASRDALKYLADTDWLIIREMDTAEPCPADVKQKRAEARSKVL